MAPTRSSRASGADTDISMADAPEVFKPLVVDPMEVDETPDYTEDETDTNPNTTASSVVGEPSDGRKRRSEATQLRRSVFGKKHDILGSSKEDDSIRRFRYLLGLTDLFRHFIETNPNPRIQEIMVEIDRQNAEAEKTKKGRDRQGGAANERRRRTEAEEDAELLKDEKVGGSAETVFRESPGFVQGGQMRDYQVAGLNWLISLHENGISGILADEMGLGKTLQTISFLGYLRHIMDITGPHLVVVPKSTLDNWKREFAKWTPEVNVLVLQGAKDERNQLINDRLIDEKFDVCITSYEMILREKSHLKKFAWEYIIIDEAHRIKNEESSLAQVIRLFNSRNRLLITGTPLQNNLHELWALLNFLLPDVFGEAEAFDQWFSGQGEDQDAVVKQLHRILRPFLLRRVKSDVEKSLLPKKEINLYIGMSDMQVKWYKKILEKDIDAVNGAGGKRESKTRLLNIVMQLRKCCNHPYLFEGAEPGPPYTTDEHLVFNAGKMAMLDRLLVRLKKAGSRVLIFSQMSRLLDILEDYCVFRDFKYCRIDGGTAHEDRIAAIDDYNKKDSEKFVFLLTTRAGGLGINLTSADIVVLYDSDWNPQADLQAMDRAHRIGQTKQVVVYRFVTENAIEEKVLERAAQKLRLDQLVIQQGRAQIAAKAAANKDELLNMIQHGAEKVFNSKGATGALAEKGAELNDDDIDEILKHGEKRTAELNARYEKLGIDDLQNFTSESAYEWNGQDFTSKKKDGVGINWINPAKRERKEQSYSMDKYYKNALSTGGRTADTKPKAPRAPKQITVHDYQFFPGTLRDLQDRETAYHRKEIGYKVPLPEGPEELSDREAERALDQAEIDAATPLTEEEQELKQKLSTEGFGDWNRRDFQQFINGSGKYGRKDYDLIAEEVDSKTSAEIKEYAKVFWQRYTEITDYSKYIGIIEAGEDKLRKTEHQKDMLSRKMKQYKVPLQQLKINYSVSTTNKKVYTEEEDRFLLVLLDRYGVDSDNIFERIRDDIRESPLFRFDWFFLSRTPIEISRRCTTLLTTVAREFEDEKPMKGTNGTNGKTKREPEDDENDEDSVLGMAPAKKKAKNGVKNKVLDNVKSGAASKATSATPSSRASSVMSTASSPVAPASAKSGHQLPLLGFGTSFSTNDDPLDPIIVDDAVKAALKAGYRHIDCAPVYQNEAAVGKGIRASGIQQEIFITTKLWNTEHDPIDVEPALDKSLQDLGLEYVDLYLIHWPSSWVKLTPFKWCPEDDTGQPIINDVPITSTWAAMEELVTKGKARSIGIGNFYSLEKLDELLSTAKIMPTVNQVNWNPYKQRRELVAYCNSKGIRCTAWGLLTVDRAKWLNVSTDPRLLEIAGSVGITPAQLTLSWAVSKGISVIPKSSTEERIRSNFQLVELPQDISDQVDALDATL